MQNRFGVKDLVLFVLVAAVGVLVFLAMKQDDRRWQATREASATLVEQARQIAEIRRGLEAKTGDDRGAGEMAAGQARQAEVLAGLVDEVRATNQRLEELLRVTASGAGAMHQALEDARRAGAEREAALEERIAAIQRELAAAASRPADGAPAAPPGGVAPTAPDPRSPPPAHDESWARPGIPVVWASPLRLPAPPQGLPGYAPGGTFLEVFEGQPPTITPYRYADVYGRRVVEQVCESLGAYDPVSLRMEGLLAEAWQYDPDGMWLRVRIHPRARFSDGAPVTADDVRFTFHDFMFNMEIEAERFRGTYNGIDRVEVLAERVAEFTFKERRFDNLAQAFLFPIVPRHFYAEFTPTQINQSTGLLIGSGPFKLASLDPNSQWKPPEDILLVRDESYWGGAEVMPAFERLRYRVIQDGLARMTAYENGAADMIRPTSDQFRLKADEPGFTSKHHALEWFNMQSGYSFIAWQCGERNGKLTPFHDARVRRAMTHLLDRDRIARDIYRRLATVATGPFNPATPQADPAIPPWPYDPHRAETLLAEAGWTDRDRDGVRENASGEEFQFELIFAAGSEAMERMCRYVKDQCAASGIRCVLDKRDWSTTQTILQNRDFDAITFALSPSAPEADPNQLWHSSAIDNQGDNWVQWRSAAGDRLIEAGRREVDDAARMRIWRELHRVIHDEQPYTFLVNIPWLRFVNKRVENVHAYPKGLEVREMFIRREHQGAPN